MSLRRLLTRMIVRVVPSRLQPHSVRARADVERLTEEQRERLRRNLRRIMAPRAA